MLHGLLRELTIRSVDCSKMRESLKFNVINNAMEGRAAHGSFVNRLKCARRETSHKASIAGITCS